MDDGVSVEVVDCGHDAVLELRLGVHFSSGVIGLVINATIGAIVLLLALRVIGASGWGGR